MTDERPPAPAEPLSGRTARARSLETPLRVFLGTETGNAAVLVARTEAALVWASQACEQPAANAVNVARGRSLPSLPRLSLRRSRLP